ncbi:hypothetical protein O3P69_001259 [Scylla paramamosain]|uniref:DRBM domain-containing protein n=1 Tax=Scylla paramamosain TaxID=85552 RepID=A0AAW0US49_SCYPA
MADGACPGTQADLTEGIKVNRKKVPGAKNLKVRRYVQPKNAIVCLNELRPGVTYTMEQEGGVCQPFCISVEVDGQKYRGFGSSKQLAKQAAAEAALIGFLKPPVTTPENQEEDKTPWATLGPTGWLRKAFIPAMGDGGPTAAVKEESPQAAAFTEAICAHLGGRAPNKHPGCGSQGLCSLPLLVVLEWPVESKLV